MKKYLYCGVALVLLMLVSAVAVQAESSDFPIPCVFSANNLELGAIGDEVKCLQKFLNNNGFKIANSGPGSPGSETGSYGSLTREAVRRWQQERGISATGIFGPLSKDRYLKELEDLVNAQLARLPVVATPAPVPQPVINKPVLNNGEEQKARDLIKSVRELIDETEDDVDDASASDLSDSERENAEDDIADAKDDLLDALFEFVDQNYSEAVRIAEKIKQDMNDIGDDLHGSKDDAEEALTKARAAIKKADKEIDNAFDDGDEVDQAKRLLNQAEDKLDDAEEDFDDKDYDAAETKAKQARALAEDAIDAIGN